MTIRLPFSVAAPFLLLVTCVTAASCSTTSPPVAAASSAASPSAGSTARTPTSSGSVDGPNLQTDPTDDVSASPSGSPSAPTPDDTSTPPAAPTAATAKAQPGGAAHACALVTQAEATAALGEDPGTGEESGDPHTASACLYGQSPNIVTVNIVPSRGKAQFDHIMANPPHRLMAVVGIGDAAYTFAAGPASSLWFVKGDSLVAIGVIGSISPNGSAAGALTLAKLVAGRI